MTAVTLLSKLKYTHILETHSYWLYGTSWTVTTDIKPRPELSQTTLDNPITGTQSFAYDVKYHLIVEGKNSTQNQLGK